MSATEHLPVPDVVGTIVSDREGAEWQRFPEGWFHVVPGGWVRVAGCQPRTLDVLDRDFGPLELARFDTPDPA